MSRRPLTWRGIAAQLLVWICAGVMLAHAVPLTAATLATWQVRP